MDARVSRIVASYVSCHNDWMIYLLMQHDNWHYFCVRASGLEREQGFHGSSCCMANIVMGSG